MSQDIFLSLYQNKGAAYQIKNIKLSHIAIMMSQ